MKNALIPRLPDSVVLSKFSDIAEALAQNEWRLDCHGPSSQLFSVAARKGEKQPWKKNSVADAIATGSGTAVRTFNFFVDGRHVANLTRPDGDLNNHLSCEQGWFGSDEVANLAYAKATDSLGAAFVFHWNPKGRSAGISPDLAAFVESRDQTLAKLEELNARFAREIFQERDRLIADIAAKEKTLIERHETKLAVLEAQHQRQSEDLQKKEDALTERLKEVDDREARFARRQIRSDLKKEIKDRQSKFELTKGTRQMRWPVIMAVILLAALLGYGFYYYTVEIVREMTATKPPEGYVLAIMLVRQLLIGLGLGGAIWFFVHWQNQWSQRHAEEEFAVKRLELDLDRASWVVELAMEWSKEKNGHELPESIARELTKNLFNDRNAAKGSSLRGDMLSEILGASTQAELEAGNAKFKLNRNGASKLRDAIQGEDS